MIIAYVFSYRVEVGRITVLSSNEVDRYSFWRESFVLGEGFVILYGSR